MHQNHDSAGTGRSVVIGIVLLILLYAIGVWQGLPQQWTAQVVSNLSHEEHGAHVLDTEDVAAHGTPDDLHGPSDDIPAYYTVIPFILLLGAIAVLPLIPRTEHWWEKNLNRFYVAACLGVVTLFYYLILHPYAVESHWPAHRIVSPAEGQTLQPQILLTVLANALLGEYVPFITLLFSLYAIAGGIRITGDLRATPTTNTLFMTIGGLLASFVGTTGAAMVLIRPLLETNVERKNVRHTVVFFIFIVCNCGGCLLPIGDPPLFLGYLQGVPFTWTFSLLPHWLFVNCSLLALYWLLDATYFHPREDKRDIVRDERSIRRLHVSGLALNGTLLLGVVLSVALLDPSKPVPGTDWHAWMYLREIVQLSLVAISLAAGSAAIRRDNNFNYHAILEVAALFFGIFICMQPALQILAVKGPALGLTTPQHFFWATGSLSAVLDNAPTYLVFFQTAKTLPSAGEAVAGVDVGLLEAISIAAVFMGAMTYIGNGPNFMVKAIAEKSGVKMPSFFGYMSYSCAILLPILAVAAWLFL